MALIAMAVYDTEENQRHSMTSETIFCVLKAMSNSNHRLVVIDNGSYYPTQASLQKYAFMGELNLISLPENIGTARAINKAWKTRTVGEHCIKIDNDVVIESTDWIDQMEEAIGRDPKIGIIGLKRKDCWENPAHEKEFYRSTLEMLPHKPGEPWIVVERVNHVIGTCQMYNSALLDKIGYLYQPGLYGFDDVLAADRCHAAGFHNCFLPHIRIDHIDPGDTPYQGWKERMAGRDMAEANRLRAGYRDGSISYFYDENGNQ